MSTERFIFVDCESEGQSPARGRLTEFGAVHFDTLETFYGNGYLMPTFINFGLWINRVCGFDGDYSQTAIFISDNPAYDFQWINFGFDMFSLPNPFGHSARRISDFYAGLRRDFRKTQDWKKWRKTPHDHNPVNDAMGNVEAFKTMLDKIKKGEL